jgi:acyl-CoA reductase-like NAD-dependent aldehyde dehydrogenase
MATKTKTISNIKLVIDKQRDFFDSNSTRDIDFRIEQLKKFKKAIQDNEENIYAALNADFKNRNSKVSRPKLVCCMKKSAAC